MARPGFVKRGRLGIAAALFLRRRQRYAVLGRTVGIAGVVMSGTPGALFVFLKRDDLDALVTQAQVLFGGDGDTTTPL